MTGDDLNVSDATGDRLSITLHQLTVTRRTDMAAVQVDAIDTDTPGLVMHPSLAGAGWTVAHLASGLAVGPAWLARAAAFEWARRLSQVTDWTGPALDIVHRPGVGRKVGALLEAFLNGNHWPVEDLE